MIDQTAARRDVALLFTPGERWGWQLRDAEPRRQVFLEPDHFQAPPDPPDLVALDDLYDEVSRPRFEGHGPRVSRLASRVHKQREARQDAWNAEVQQLRSTWNAETAPDIARKRAQFEEEEERRLRALPLFHAVRSVADRREVGVFGGAPSEGWSRLLVTLVTSMVGSAQGVRILDFSQADVPAALYDVLRAAGRRVDKVVFPDDAAAIDLFGGLNADAIADVVAEALHTEETDGSRQRRALDERLLHSVCCVLGGTVTLERICAGLSVALRRTREKSAAAILSDEEHDALAVILSDDDRTVLAERAVVIEASLRGIRRVGREPDRGFGGEDEECSCISLSERTGALATELLTDLLVQRTIRLLRNSARGANPASQVLIVVGADRLQRRHLDQIRKLASHTSLRLVYFFERFDERAAENAGAGDALTVFMRLGNQREAERAADFIGKDHRFVRSQITVSASTSINKQWGSTWGGLSSGESFSDAVAEQAGRSYTLARVHEHSVTAETIRGFTVTEVLLVDFVKGQRVLKSASCDPVLAFAPGASMLPLPETAAAGVLQTPAP